MANDIRKPLAGITKETYVNIVEKAGGSREVAELDYDMRAGIESKIGLIVDNCQCRLKQCEKKFVSRAHRRFSLTWFELVCIGGSIFFLLGLGVLNWEDIVGFIKP